MRSLRRIVIFVIPILLIGFAVSTLYKWNYIQHEQRWPDEFNIPNLGVGYDANKNRVDDARDILEAAKDYVARNPHYEELKEYEDGWPTGNSGSNGDVVAYALNAAGYNLKSLIYQDIQKNPEVYGDTPQGENIAFRVVENQRIFLQRYGEPKDTNFYNKNEWQAGDIIFFEKNHVAIVADKVNKNGVRFIIHHFWEHQAGYFQDVLETEAWGKIVGHYRISARALSPKTDVSSVKTIIN